MKTTLVALAVILAAVAMTEACNGICNINVGGNVGGNVGIALEESTPHKIVQGDRLIPVAACDEPCGQNDAEAALGCCRKSGLRVFSSLCVNGRAYCV